MAGSRHCWFPSFCGRRLRGCLVCPMSHPFPGTLAALSQTRLVSASMMSASTPFRSTGSARSTAIRQRQAVCLQIPSSLPATRHDHGLSASNMLRTQSMSRSGRRIPAIGVPVDPHHVREQSLQRQRRRPVLVEPQEDRSREPQCGQRRSGQAASITNTASALLRAVAKAASALAILRGGNEERLARRASMTSCSVWCMSVSGLRAEPSYWPSLNKPKHHQYAMLTSPHCHCRNLTVCLRMPPACPPLRHRENPSTHPSRLSCPLPSVPRSRR